MPRKPQIVLPDNDYFDYSRSQDEAKNFFSDREILKEIYGKVEKILSREIDRSKTKSLIDPKSLNGNGGHLLIFTISGDGGDGNKPKQYHIKPVTSNEGISLEHEFTEPSYYSIYHNFGYGPKTSVLMYKNSLILLLEDAGNLLPDESSAKFSDWKKIKEDGSRSDIEEKLTSSKADLYAVEILTLILGTGDIFQKPDNYGVRIIDKPDGTKQASPFVIDLLPLGAYVTFFGKIGASGHCEDFDNPKKYAKLIADLLLKSFDPEGDQRKVMAIQDFHVFEFFKDGIRGSDIKDLKGGLQIILNDEFDEKIIKAFDD